MTYPNRHDLVDLILAIGLLFAIMCCAISCAQFDASYPGGSVHIIGYWPSPPDTNAPPRTP